MSSETKINIRQATKNDFPFIEWMCYEAAFPDYLKERLSFEEAKQLDWFQAYTDDWPSHEGDYGVVAESEDGERIGAAWYRDYPREELSQDIPTHELSIALIPEARGRQTGRKLMENLLKGARGQGIEKLVLQVKPENERAKALYEQVGFQTITQSPEGYDVMITSTSPDNVK
jgi:ribosomal protein S18 acetylase RimI-like enzyme